MPRNKLPEETTEKILSMYNNGINNNIIQKSLKVDIKTIRRIINKNKAGIYLEKFRKLKIIEPIKPKDLNMVIPMDNQKGEYNVAIKTM